MEYIDKKNFFRAGEKVVCIKGDEQLGFKQGKIYTIEKFGSKGDDPEWNSITSDKGDRRIANHISIRPFFERVGEIERMDLDELIWCANKGNKASERLHKEFSDEIDYQIDPENMGSTKKFNIHSVTYSKKEKAKPIQYRLTLTEVLTLTPDGDSYKINFRDNDFKLDELMWILDNFIRNNAKGFGSHYDATMRGIMKDGLLLLTWTEATRLLDRLQYLKDKEMKNEDKG